MVTASDPFLPFVFVTGGCRSGKSAYAERLALHFRPKALYLATALPSDEEMRRRILVHRRRRGDEWRLHELAPGKERTLWRDIGGIVRPDEALLFDCLSLWSAACMCGDDAPQDFDENCDRLIGALRALPCPVILVNCEVGMGLVPAHPAGRAFRDMSGSAAQKAAAAADAAVLVVSGLPLTLKGTLPSIAPSSPLLP